jgi:hypothetical protein
MASVLSFALFLLGLTFLQGVDNLQKNVSSQVSRAQSQYASYAGNTEGLARVKDGQSSPIISDWIEYYDDVMYRTTVALGQQGDIFYGLSQGYNIVGEGSSSYPNWGGDFRWRISRDYETSTYADYLYLSDIERDPMRNDIIRFWTPDTLDGKVHSNDTLHISGSPRFKKRVTSSAPVIDPPDTYARFDEGLGLNAARIFFPDKADEVRRYTPSSHRGWGTSIDSDSATEITFSGPLIYRRYCGWEVDDEDSSFICFPQFITNAPSFLIPSTGALFIEGKVLVKADRGRPDIMDPSFISLGYEGRMTMASSDTMIIPDNLIYRYANPDNSVPGTQDSIRDVLGLISENYIMFGEDVDDTIYVNAAMAAIRGSITVQDIYRYGYYNEKQSLFIYGSLAQKNRGLVHSSYNGGLRGFIEKDYHYDKRLAKFPPPHFLSTRENPNIYYEDFFEEG